MPDEAKVRSIDELEAFRANLIVFVSKARKAIDSVGEEIRRTRLWVESDRGPFWQAQVKKRSRLLEQANAELITARMSNFVENPMLQQQQVRKAKAALEEAEQKVMRCKHWSRSFDSTVMPLAKKLESITQFIDFDMPQAIQFMAQIIRLLDAYAERISSMEPKAPTAETTMETSSPVTP
jgi:hypothetical protein